MLLLMSWKLKEKSDYTSHPETAGRHSACLLLTGAAPCSPSVSAGSHTTPSSHSSRYVPTFFSQLDSLYAWMTGDRTGTVITPKHLLYPANFDLEISQRPSEGWEIHISAMRKVFKEGRTEPWW